MSCAPFIDEFMRRLRYRQFAEVVFDYNFPGRCYAEIDLVVWVFKQILGLIGEVGTV